MPVALLEREWGRCILVSGISLFSMAAMGAEATEIPPATEEMYLGDVPVVSSVTRLVQPVTNSPVAVTIIDHDMIEASGAREIPELFRLVPGFQVGYFDGHTPSVSYHMALDRYARRMQVLIDGRSVYVTAVGGVPWAELPITIDDIVKIEVVRGPNSASYGANSFFGVISITTRHAQLDRGTSVKLNAGDEGVREGFVRHGSSLGKLDYRVNAAYIHDDGLPVRRDYKRTQIAGFRGDYAIDANDAIMVDLGVSDGVRGVINSYSSVLNVPREKQLLTHHQQLRWERKLAADNSLSIQLYHIYQRNNETYTIGGFSVGPFTVDQTLVDFGRKTQRFDLELQQNVRLTPDFQLVWGGGIREDRVWGAENLLKGKELDNFLKDAFVSAEWDVKGPLSVNAGLFAEDYSTTGTHFSPRAGMIYTVAPGHSLRFTASQAIRTPSMFEYAAEYGIHATTNHGAGPVLNSVSWVGTQQTRPEHITAYELGYNGASGDANFDIKLYQERVRDLIRLISRPYPADNVDHEVERYENLDAFYINGLEIEFRTKLSENNSLHLGYAYADVDHTVIYFSGPKADYNAAAPQHNLSLLLMHHLNHEWKASAGFYFTDKLQGWESTDVRDPVQRLDLTLGQATRMFGHETELTLAMRNIFGPYEEMELLRSGADPNRYFDPNRFAYRNLNPRSAFLSLKVQLD
ncbi:MAG: TonB-dependent receptor [Gammaproteobacteria bacterium]|nr:TonB-dependent receptor [Gammaproteobacteria bacterium]